MKRQRQRSISRRKFITTAAAGAAIVVSGATGLAAPKRKRAAGASAAASAAPTPSPVGHHEGKPASDAVRELFGPLREGTRLGPYQIVAIFAETMGAIPVLLKRRGIAPFQVDVLRRDDAVEAVGTTPSLSVFVVNRGDGRRWTGNPLGLGAMALASALSAREKAGAPVPSLLTLRERHAKYPGAMFDVVRA